MIKNKIGDILQAMAKKKLIDFNIRVAKAQTDYENLFGEPAPSFGYDEEELLENLEQALESKEPMDSMAEKTYKSVGAESDDEKADIKI